MALDQTIHINMSSEVKKKKNVYHYLTEDNAVNFLRTLGKIFLLEKNIKMKE